MAALIKAQHRKRQSHGNKRANGRQNADEERAESSPLHTVTAAILFPKNEETAWEGRFPGRFVESGRRDLNPRHLAWEASALPTELRPHGSSIVPPPQE
jgi:hypothetical protein